MSVYVYDEYTIKDHTLQYRISTISLYDIPSLPTAYVLHTPKAIHPQGDGTLEVEARKELR